MKSGAPGRESVAGLIGCHKEGTSCPFVMEKKGVRALQALGAPYEVAEL
jgi:hypothetical protein